MPPGIPTAAASPICSGLHAGTCLRRSRSGAAALIGDPPDDLPAAVARWVEAARTSMKNLKPKPVLHMAGENDPLVRFAWQKRTIDELRKLNGCGEGQPGASTAPCTRPKPARRS